MTELRRTALVLHGLTQADREWMLARLSESQADELRELLDELRGLGIPADSQLLRSAIDNATQGRGGAPGHAELSRASIDAVHSLLCNEPERLIAIVLSSGAWPWKEALLDRFSPARARRIRELAQRDLAGAALRSELLAELSRRIVRCSAAPRAEVPRQRVWGSLRKRWPAWMR